MSSNISAIVCRSLLVIAPGCALLLACGCGGENDGLPRYSAYGGVTFDSKPVPSGVVTFEHVESRHIAVCPIEDGSYESATGKGPLAGKNVVRIAGYDGPEGKLLWGNEWTTEVDVSEEGLQKDFAISKTDVKPPGSRLRVLTLAICDSLRLLVSGCAGSCRRSRHTRSRPGCERTRMREKTGMPTKAPRAVSRPIATAITLIGVLFQLRSTDASRADEQQPLLDSVVNVIGMKLVRVPAGEFVMGAPESEHGSREDERPEHPVRLTRPLWLGQFEVTQQQYMGVMGENPSFFSPAAGGHGKVTGLDTSQFPVENVSWESAVEFCRRLSELPEERVAGRIYRLPTEAEWQYACRAGTTSAFHTGDSLAATQANFNGNFPYGDAPRGRYLGRTTTVGSYDPNAFGLYDMHGNVAEMCSDWYARYYYRMSPSEDPQGPENGADRVVMGGSWGSDALRCRSAYRRSNAPSGHGPYFGFRVACTFSNDE